MKNGFGKPSKYPKVLVWPQTSLFKRKARGRESISINMQISKSYCLNVKSSHRKLENNSGAPKSSRKSL